MAARAVQEKLFGGMHIVPINGSAGRLISRRRRSRSLSILAPLMILAASAAGANELRELVEHYRVGHEKEIVAQLDELARIPSIAAEPQGLIRAADRLKALLDQRGFQTALLSAGSGLPPVVFGSLRHQGATHTVVFYAHYDGQPVTPSQWRSDPFVPVMRNGTQDHDVAWTGARAALDPEWRLFGRAVSDDKASIVAFLGAWDAL